MTDKDFVDIVIDENQDLLPENERATYSRPEPDEYDQSESWRENSARELFDAVDGLIDKFVDDATLTYHGKPDKIREAIANHVLNQIKCKKCKQAILGVVSIGCYCWLLSTGKIKQETYDEWTKVKP